MATDEVPAGLWLIGIGPGDLEHMTERARSVARGCKKRYLEGYTAVLPTEQEALLESVVGPWERLMRPSVESPETLLDDCLLYTSPSPRDKRQSRMPSSA